MSRGWLLLLCAVLLVWQPLNFAVGASAALPTIGMRGPAASVELVAHGLIAALSVAAGWALWQANPAGPMLAAAALVMGALGTVQSLYWTALPNNVFPSDRLPLAALTLGHAAVWLVYLHRSKRIRAMS